MFKYSVLIIMISMVCFESMAGDPTRPPRWLDEASHKKVDRINKYALQQILISDLLKVAVIDGFLVEVGDSVGGAKVIGIGNDWVKLKRKSKIMRLNFTKDLRVTFNDK